MKVLLFSAFLAVFLFTAAEGRKVKYRDCGSAKAVISHVDISDCNSFPCKFKRGGNYSVEIGFLSNTNTKTATVKATGIVAMVPVPYPIGNTDACSCGVKCPIIASDHNTYKYQMQIKSYFPSVKVVVKWEIKADDGSDLVCIEFPAEVTA